MTFHGMDAWFKTFLRYLHRGGGLAQTPHAQIMMNFLLLIHFTLYYLFKEHQGALGGCMDGGKGFTCSNETVSGIYSYGQDSAYQLTFELEMDEHPWTCQNVTEYDGSYSYTVSGEAGGEDKSDNITFTIEAYCEYKFRFLL